MSKPTVFISYSHKDEGWKDRLVTHLAVLREQGIVDLWDDRRIAAGEDWERKIQDAMDAASIAMLLVSAHSLTSKFILREEVSALLKRRSNDGLQIFPVIITPCDWEAVDWLCKMQLRPKDGHALSGGNEYQIDLDLAAIAKEVRTFLSPIERRSSSQKPMIRTMPRRLPGRLIAATVGWFDYHRAHAFRRTLLQVWLNDGLERAVVGDNFRIPFQDRLLGNQLSGKRVVVICGPAGIGKTRFASKLLGQYQEKVDLIIVLHGSSLGNWFSSTSGHNNDDAIAQEILTFLSETLTVDSGRRLSRAAIACALNYKRVLLVLEDLHHSGLAKDALRQVRTYFERRHRWGKHVSIIVTTREPRESLKQHLGSDTEIISLTPMSQEVAQDFFYRLCLANGVEQSRLTEHGDKIAKAFNTDRVRTPLFIVICAWLATHGTGTLDVGTVLEMRTSEVFDAFIAQLYRRSTQPEEDYQKFCGAYEQLALTLWPDCQDCREDSIRSILGGLALQNSAFHLTFLLDNGFLFRSRYEGVKIDFPHQSMAHYLATKRMIRLEDFGKIQLESSKARVEGLVPFLAELIDNDEQLEKLAQTDMSVLVEVVKQRLLVGRSQIPIQKIVKEMARWACNKGSADQSPETWICVRDLIEGRVAKRWVDELCQEVEASDDISPQGIEALAALERDPTRNLLYRWLSDSRRFPAFQKAAATPTVQQLLLGFVADTFSKLSGRAAFRLLWNQEKIHVPDDLKRWTVDHVSALEAADIEAVCAQGSSGIRLLAEAVSERPIPLKQTVSAVVSRISGKVLIPCGVYDVPSEGEETRRVRISRPLLVPITNQPLAGRFNSSEALKISLDRRLGKYRVMTKYQALVALNYFPHRVNSIGVVFNPPQDDTKEIFLDEKGRMGAYVIPNTSTTAIQRIGESFPTRSNVLTNVTFRIVETL